MDARVKCLARGHDRHLFGDITDTLIGGQVYNCDLVRGEEDAVSAIGIEGSDDNAFAAEGPGNDPGAPLEADVILGGGNGAHNLMLVVFHLRQAVRHRVSARPETADRHVLIKSLVWAFEIVDRTPGVEGLLYLCEIAELPEGKHLGLQRAMEALVLTAALWMVRPAVQDGDAELEQPYRELRPALAGRISPRVAVVDEEGLRQSIAAEDQFQSVLYGVAPLIGAGRKTKIVARMVVHHGQGMAPTAARKRHVTLEVHLPKLVGLGPLKAQMSCSTAQRGNNPAMPAQDLVHRRMRRTDHPFALQAMRDLARAPGRMGIAPRQNALLNRCFGPGWTRMRAPQTIPQFFFRSPSGKPLVPSIGMNPEPPAQFASVRPFLHRQLNKLTSLIQHRHLLPRHGGLPEPIPCNDDVSVMSPNTRRGCLRAIHLTRASMRPLSR